MKYYTILALLAFGCAAYGQAELKGPSLKLGTAGVRITQDGDGAITLTGQGNGSDEAFTFNLDDTSNTIVISSSTGVTAFDFGSIGITSSGTGTFGSANIGGSVIPATNDASDLGDETHGFRTLFMAQTADINVNDGNWLLTWSSGIGTIGTGELRITTAGTNAASVITQGSTNTVTNKSISLGSNTVTSTLAQLNTAVTDAEIARTDAANTFTGAQTLAESADVVLDSVLSADGTWTGISMPGVAGATLAFGDVVYLDPTDSRWELVDANSAAAADGDARGLVGVCVLAAASDGSATKILMQGTVRADAAFPTFTIGAEVFLSETAGDATSTAPTTTDSVKRVLGWAIDGNSIYVAPAGSWTTHT